MKAPEHHCGAGGDAPLVRLAEVSPDQKHPSTNADVWLMEGGANALYTDDSPICPACWMAYLEPIDKWSRSLGDPASFRNPLATAIRNFPVPARSQSSVVYNQLYGSGTFTESVGFWCERDDELTRRMNDYAQANHLALDLEPGPPNRRHQLLVSASYTRRV